MRNVLLTNMYGALGGGELCLLEHARDLVSKAIGVTVALLEPGALIDELRQLGIDVVVLPFAWQGNKIASLTLIVVRVADFVSLIRRDRPDLVVAYTFNDFVFAGLAARLTSTPVVYRSQGDLFLPEHRNGDTWLDRCCCRSFVW